MDDLKQIFEKYVRGGSIFKDKRPLQSDFYETPLLHRDEQISKLAKILAPVLRGELPSNVFIYGPTGTGKTAVVKKVVRDLKDVADEHGVDLHYLYINCGLRKVADTEYRLFSHIANTLGFPTPTAGVPKAVAIDNMVLALESIGGFHIIILDEIDVLIQKSKGALYTLTRLNEELQRSKVILIGITNDVASLHLLDSRIKSALSVEEIYFPPYNAVELKDILDNRAKAAFADGVLSEGVISLVAAYSAKHHGDARRAIELLRVSAELAEREGSSIITKAHVEEAIKHLTYSSYENAIKTLPHHAKLVLRAIISLQESGLEVYTGNIYSLYVKICSEEGIKPLTARRVTDLILQMESLGIVVSTVISKGRYGRTRIVSAVDEVLNLLTEKPHLLEVGL